MRLATSLAFVLTCGLAGIALADDLSLPARTLPAPASDDISPQMQRIIAAKPNPNANPLWKTGEEARAGADAAAVAAKQRIPGLLERLNLTMTAQTMDGVRVHVITPK